MSAVMISQISRRKKVALMASVMLSMLFTAMDQTVVSTALPRVVASLGGLSHYSWVFTAFMLTSTITLPISGKLSDMYGRKPFFITGLVLFMIGSALCGTSQNMAQLIFFRAFQGIGAGIVMANAFAIIGDIFPPAERGKWGGLVAGTFAMASVLGPPLGGYITDNVGWRWIFYINLPLGTLATSVLAINFPSIKAAGLRREVDYWGAATLILAAVPLLLALAWAGSTYPWASPQVTGLLAFSALAWFTFIWLENRAREPILPLSFFKNSIFVVSTAVVLTLGMGMFGTIMFVPLFIQGVIGFSATSSGVVTMPMSIALAIGSTLGGQWMSRWSHYRIIGLTGIIIATTGMYLLSRMGVDTTYASAVRNMLVLGFGLGITMPIFVVVVQNALPYSQLGAVTSAIQFFRSIGGTLGVAIMGSLLTTRLSMELPRQIPPQVKQAIPPEQFSQFVNPQILVNPSILTQVQQQFSQLGPQGRELFQQLLEGLKSALALSIHEAFLVGLVIVALAIIACLFLKEIPLRKTHGPVFEEVASGAIREGVD